MAPPHSPWQPFSSVCMLLLSCWVMFNSLRPHGLPCFPGSSTLGLPVLHHVLEFAQTHAHWVGDAIQPSHPLSPPSPPALTLSQHQGHFDSASIQVVAGGRLFITLASIFTVYKALSCLVFHFTLIITQGCRQGFLSPNRWASESSGWGWGLLWQQQEMGHWPAAGEPDPRAPSLSLSALHPGSRFSLEPHSSQEDTWDVWILPGAPGMQWTVQGWGGHACLPLILRQVAVGGREKELEFPAPRGSCRPRWCCELLRGRTRGLS